MAVSLPETDEPEPTTTAIEAVFEKLLGDIVSGVYVAGTRLPAERELSRQLGASRPTLREALRRLGEWNLVEPRRGSGIVIRPYRDWTIGVMGAYLRYGKPTEHQPAIPQIIADALAMRRAIYLEIVRATAPRVPKGGTAPARLAMARAWAMRDQPSYPREDFEVLRRIVEAAKFTPGVWMLNTVAGIYLDLAASFRFVINAPEDYVAVHTRFFDLIEDGDAVAASNFMQTYLERHDATLTRLLPMVP
jgi:GntR family transcriptional repressor for pyruvate dehydrogenase complex